ncbi:MAG: nucleoside hydrolase [Pseudomonadota bacterium]
MSETVPSIYIDTDPGQDDAVALLMAFGLMKVKRITTVAGNVAVPLTTANALRVRDLAGASAPVNEGADRPLVSTMVTAEFVTGKDGLAASHLPPPASEADPTHAVDALIADLKAEAPGTAILACLGPLTNIALALRMAPEIAEAIGRIVLMGGARDLGNITPAAEFNVYADPHAAAIVLASGVPITLIGLHATNAVVLTPEEVHALEALDTKAARTVVSMMSRPRPGGMEGTRHPLHDPCVMAAIHDPSLVSGRDCHVTVSLDDGEMRGRTTIDWNGRLGKTPNAFVVDRVDVRGLFAALRQALQTLDARGPVGDVIAEEAAKAEGAIAAMRQSAVSARTVHARAELLRHMRLTAKNTAEMEMAAAIDAVMVEWTRAWQVPLDTPLAGAMRDFTTTMCEAARGQSGDGEVRRALIALDSACEAAGTSLADEMAYRSECAHGWWAAVVPPPGADKQPFWEDGAAPHCLGEG